MIQSGGKELIAHPECNSAGLAGEAEAAFSFSGVQLQVCPKHATLQDQIGDLALFVAVMTSVLSLPGIQQTSCLMSRTNCFFWKQCMIKDVAHAVGILQADFTCVYLAGL